MYCIMHQCFGVDTSYGFWLGLTTLASGWNVTRRHGGDHGNGDASLPHRRPSPPVISFSSVILLVRINVGLVGCVPWVHVLSPTDTCANGLNQLAAVFNNILKSMLAASVAANNKLSSGFTTPWPTPTPSPLALMLPPSDS
jgi:hypothetical protein